jgi:hypothetical protein
MKVRDLISLLENEDPDAEAHFAYASGNYWRTVAPTIRNVELGYVKDSAYHNKPVLLSNDDDDNDDATKVVVLS